MAVRRMLEASLAVAIIGVAANAAPPPDPAAEIAKLEASVPPPRAADVASIDAIMHAIYDVISGPPGPRDWNRFRSLMVPVARLTTSTIDAHGRPRVVLIGVEDYISKAGAHFAAHGFFESGLVNKVDRFGNVAQVFSSYASRTTADGKPFARGINFMQLLYDGKRWWVLSILWDEERAGNPLPKAMGG